MPFFISLFLFLLWSIFIIFLYYWHNSSHIGLLATNNIGYLSVYFGIIIALFIGYKAWKIRKDDTQNSWNFVEICIGFLVQLFLVCAMYGMMISEHFLQANVFLLFVRTLGFLLIPIFFVFLWRAMGASMCLAFSEWKTLPLRFRAPTETAIGMTITILVLLILSYFGVFINMTIALFLGISSILSWFGWKQIWQEIRDTSIQIQDSPLSWKIISAEGAFIIFTFVASVSLLSIFRPFPIGWDDMGVYMNFPRMIAESGEILHGAGFLGWQLITAIGFAFHSPTLAFFLNQIGGFLATIAIICSLSLLLTPSEKSNTRTLLILPMLLGIVYYIMPMTIFQQAKDMKVDPALMFMSITALMNLIWGIRGFYEKRNTKHILALICISGILAGVAFSIKMTSLMLLVASVGFLAYSFLGIFGFFGFFAIFVSIFTGGNLWSHMFVWMPANSEYITIISGIIGIIFLGYSFYQHKNEGIFFFKATIIFGLGACFALAPWLVKNVSELQGKSISVSTLLSGSGDVPKNGHFITDYKKLYDEKTLEQKNAEIAKYSTITGDGQSLNEDFARYFGKESGLNNYIKLPLNLTLQKNQNGEFTDITYIFLAFVPVAILFLPTERRKNFSLAWIGLIGVFLVGGIITFLPIIAPEKFFIITQFFGNIPLPFGYAVLMGLVFTFLILVHIFGKKSLIEDKIRLGLLFFLGIYGLLFWVSAFGIVWYGVLVYFLFLAVIGYGIHEGTSIQDEQTHNSHITMTKYVFSIIFTILLGIYILGSAVLHSWKNLQSTGYNEYKYAVLSSNTATFAYKSDFFPALLALNTSNTEYITNGIAKAFLESKLAKDFSNAVSENDYHNPIALHRYMEAKYHTFASIPYHIQQYNQSAEQAKQQILTKNSISSLEKAKEISAIQSQLQKITQQLHQQKRVGEQEIPIIDSILSTMYARTLSPDDAHKNTHAIYRIGTFFPYFISQNRMRFLEDSLLTHFQVYFYDNNSDITVKRLKKVGLKYFLIDLNAATIDNPASYVSVKNAGGVPLTARFENLLRTLQNPKLKLIHTDDICLDIGINDSRKGLLRNEDEFLALAGGSYTSYVEDGNELSFIPQQSKRKACEEYILHRAQSEKGLFGNAFSHLSQIEDEQTWQLAINNAITRRGNFAIFEILD